MRILIFGASSILVACSSSPAEPHIASYQCPRDSVLPPSRIANCLQSDGIIDAFVAARLDSSLYDARVLSSALRTRGDTLLGRVVDSAMQRLSHFYHDGLLDDSTRVNRLGDHLSVTQQFATGAIHPIGPRYYTSITPAIAWHYYASTGAGIFAHSLETVQALGARVPDSLYASTDSLRAAAEALWRYAVWYHADGRRFPVWEYLFKNDISGPAGSGYHHMIYPPWRSSMPQGDVMRLFTVLFRRTREAVWSERAKAVLVSFDTPWSRGGVRLDDTTDGYWYEEALPEAMIWNGSMQALVDVGVYAETFPSDSLGTRLWRRGLDAAYQFTPDYDTGTWLRYSRVQGNVAGHYRNFYVALALSLGRLSGDTATWKSYARRWAGYAIPSGTCVGGPCNDAPAPAVP